LGLGTLRQAAENEVQPPINADRPFVVNLVIEPGPDLSNSNGATDALKSVEELWKLY
jgi:hypothetical protein